MLFWFSRVYWRYNSINHLVVIFHRFWYISLFRLFLVNLTLSLNGRSSCTFGFEVTFKSAGLLAIVEVVKQACQKSHTSFLVMYGVSFRPVFFFRADETFNFCLSFSKSSVFLTAVVMAFTLLSSSKGNSRSKVESCRDNRWVVTWLVLAGFWWIFSFVGVWTGTT